MFLAGKKKSSNNLNGASKQPEYRRYSVVMSLEGMLEYRLNNLVDNLVEVFLLNAAKAALDVSLDVAGQNLALHEAGLRGREAVNHVVTQWVGVLRVEPVVRRDEHKVEHSVLVLLQLIITDDDGWMGLERAVRKEEADLYDVSLMILHR